MGKKPNKETFPKNKKDHPSHSLSFTVSLYIYVCVCVDRKRCSKIVVSKKSVYRSKLYNDEEKSLKRISLLKKPTIPDLA